MIFLYYFKSSTLQITLIIVTMYSPDKNINNIMISLNHDFAIFISKWFYKNFMVLNPDKCSFMLLYFLLKVH